MLSVQILFELKKTLHFTYTFKPDEIIPEYDKDLMNIVYLVFQGWDTTIAYNSFNQI